MVNPPEKTDMGLTKAPPSGSSQPGGSEEVGRPQTQSQGWGLRVLGLGEHSRGAFGLHRRVEGQEDFLEEEANKQGPQDIKN